VTRASIPRLRVVVGLAAAGACSIAAAHSGGAAAPDLERARALRDALVRPFVLPFVWNGIETAQRDGTPGEVVQRARLLLELMPRWTDVQTHFAARLAFDDAVRLTDPEQRLDRLLAALEMLERSVAAAPAAAAELRMTMASFVRMKTRIDAPLAQAWRARFGTDHTDAEQRYLARARAARLDRATAAALREDEIHTWLRVVAGALRMGDRARARSTVDVALSMLPELADRATGERYAAALRTLAAFLDGQAPASALRGDPFLTDFADALGVGKG
jgi:hypothetical protein